MGEDIARARQPGRRRISRQFGLQEDLDKLGFNLIGFGCTTCIGNSGPLAPAISKTINDNGIVAAAVLSGNRNFEGRVLARRAGRTTSPRRRSSSRTPLPAR